MHPVSLNLVAETITQSTYEVFAPFPWCLQLLRDPRHRPVQTIHQHPNPHIPSRFLSLTLRDHDAINAVQSLLYRPQADDTTKSAATDPDTCRQSPDNSSNRSRSTTELKTLYVLGKGVEGYADISQGGFIATLLDQQAGALAVADPDMATPHTVFCNIRYLWPVSIPGAVLVTAWKAKVEGRKHWITVELVDGQNVVLARAETLFVNAKQKL